LVKVNLALAGTTIAHRCSTDVLAAVHCFHKRSCAPAQRDIPVFAYCVTGKRIRNRMRRAVPWFSMAQNMYSTVYIRHLHDIEAQLTTDAGSEGSE